jgi:peptidoglycan/LPS O-acetylase OafA/YrhL
MTARTGRVPALDGVRGLAILLVLMAHILPSLLDNAGWLGVDLFFVLSGYLITTVLVEGKADPDRARTFYTRRALRIFPLYYGTLLLVLVLPPIFHIPLLSDAPDTWSTTSHELTWFWPYLCNWSIGLFRPTHPSMLTHFWSLAVEEQFYLVWPWIIWRCEQRTARGVAWGAIVIAVALRVTLVLIHTPMLTIYCLTPCRMDALAIGALVALTPRATVGRAFAPPAAIAAVILTVIALRFHSLRPTNQWVASVGFTCGDILAGLLVIVAVRYSPAVLTNPVLRWFGTYSYGLYVLHPFAIRSLDLTVWDSGDRSFGIMAFGLSCVVAWISYNAYELPFLRRKNRLGPSGAAASRPEAHVGTLLPALGGDDR